MVIVNNDIDLLIHLCQKPEKATPMDMEWLSELLKAYPDFDLLRKVYVTVGEKFGMKDVNFQKEKDLWNLKIPFYESDAEKVKQVIKNEIDQYSVNERIDFFLQKFVLVHSPSAS